MDYEAVLKGKYPAKTHAKKVADYLKDKGHNTDGIIYLEGQKSGLMEDSDEPIPFRCVCSSTIQVLVGWGPNADFEPHRQRRYFFYLSGCDLPDSYLTYNIPTSTLTLYIPPIDPDSVIWSGLPLSPEEALQKYDVDAAYTTADLPAHLSSGTIPPIIYAISDQISPSTTFSKGNHLNVSLVKPAIEECRVTKTPYELALIHRANIVSSEAHLRVLKAVRSLSNEREIEAIFKGHCIASGCRSQAYPPICASGTHAATLHYPHNDQPLKGKLNLLIDAAGEYDCYAADITRTFPISGTFTKDSRALYDLVLRMQQECTEMLTADVLWDDVHAHAHRVAIDGLLALGVLKGDKNEIFDKRISTAFFPHGLGHYLGMDTHDVGGHPNYEDSDPMFRYLRVRGRLPANSVITVEPGIYFCEFIIEPFLKDPEKSKYIERKVLDRFWEVGGVRIEDNVLVKEKGWENLTGALKEVDEMEKVIRGES